MSGGLRGLVILSAFVGLATSAQAQILPGAIQPGTVRIGLQSIATGLTSPVAATFAPGDASDLFVVDQIGKIRVIHNGVLQTTPFLDVSSIESAIPLSASYDERGLLGLAFSPDFVTSHKLYTYQSEKAGTGTADFGPLSGTIDHQNVLVEWQVGVTAFVVNPNSRRDLLRENHPASNHNGGSIAFGPDGDLYMGFGDGGGANDSGNGHISSTGNGQSLAVVMGKILRIDPNGTNSTNQKYGIPASNPFFNTSGAVKEIYAYGLRNPYAFSFDSATGALYVGDVGQNNVEEVDQVTSGQNYGWATKEGTFLFHRSDGTVGANSPGSPAGLVDPLWEYDHTAGTAVIGGFIYHGSLLPQLTGSYIFGDLSGRLFYATPGTAQINEFKMSAALGLNLKGFGQDAGGEIYVLASSNLGPTGTGGVVDKILPGSIWTGASSTSWSASGNWSGVVPGATTGTTNQDTASFIQTATNSPIAVDSGRNVLNLAFTTANVGPLTVGTTAGPALLLTAGGSVQTTPSVINPQIVNAPLVLEGNYKFKSDAATAAATLSFGGRIMPGPTSGSTTLTLDGGNAGANTISGALADNGAGKLAVTKTGGGLWVLSGSNTNTGNITVSGGTLRFNVPAGIPAPTIGSGVSATVAAGATLELAGSVSALGHAGGNRVHVVNNSTAPGVLVSGTNQVVGAIDGTGNTQVSAGGNLTADHIIQTALLIGGASGNPGRVTIDPADASGNPLSQVANESPIDGLVQAQPAYPASLGASAALASIGLAAGDLSPADGRPTGSSAAVPEPNGILLLLIGIVALGVRIIHFSDPCRSVFIRG